MNWRYIMSADKDEIYFHDDGIVYYYRYVVRSNTFSTERVSSKDPDYKEYTELMKEIYKYGSIEDDQTVMQIALINVNSDNRPIRIISEAIINGARLTYNEERLKSGW